MKIVIIGTTGCGIIGFRRELIQALVNKGCQVYAFANSYTAQQKAAAYALGAVPLTYSINRTGINPLADLWGMVKLSQQIKDINPTIVFSYFSKPVIFGTLAAKLAGVKRIVAMLEGLGSMFTEQPEGYSKKVRLLQKVQILLYKISLPLATKIIFLNPDDPRDLIVKNKIKVKKVAVLGGIGLSLTHYPYVKPQTSPVSFLFIGRLLKEKGIREFMSAAKLVKKDAPHITFTVLGELDQGNLGSLKKSELEELVSSGVINYLGQVDDVPHHIANSSVFVLPSYREGVPRSTQEAMAIGRPVITTDVPGCRETVVSGVNGFLIKPWCAQELAEKMRYFIAHPEMIEPMGLASYRIAQEKFDANEVNERLITLLTGSTSVETVSEQLAC